MSGKRPRRAPIFADEWEPVPDPGPAFADLEAPALPATVATTHDAPPASSEQNHPRIPADLGDLARALALDVARIMRQTWGDGRVPGIGATLRLLALLHGDLHAAELHELDRRRLAALAHALHDRAAVTQGGARA